MRKQKDSVSYFPHDANAYTGDTLTVLQSRFGNDGYAFWFKLLEKLASTDGHYIDVSNTTKWHLLLARTGVNDETGVDILKLLVEMNAIDEELWEYRIIWCQNLVDNLDDVYKNRRRTPPTKPEIPGKELLSSKIEAKPEHDVGYCKVEEGGLAGQTTDVIDFSTDEKGVKPCSNLVEIPQSKVKYSKVNKTIPPDFIDKDIWRDFLIMRAKIRKPPTDRAIKEIFEDLENFKAAGDDPNRVLLESIKNSWAGVFRLKNDMKGGQRGFNKGHSRQLPERTDYTPPY